MPPVAIFRSMSQQSVASEKTVSLTVNGEEKELPAGSSVADLLESHKLDPRMVVVEHNRVILRDRDAYARIGLNEGDIIEIDSGTNAQLKVGQLPVFQQDQISGGVAFWAHVMGFIAGLVLVVLMKRPERTRVEWWDTLES